VNATELNKGGLGHSIRKEGSSLLNAIQEEDLKTGGGMTESDSSEYQKIKTQAR